MTYNIAEDLDVNVLDELLDEAQKEQIEEFRTISQRVLDNTYFTEQNNKTRMEKILENGGEWLSFYRQNPHRFARDYLNINLKPFQQVLLYEMFHQNYMMYIASRSQGKTWLTAVFCVCYAILYPGSKIVIAAGTKGQALKIVTEKIPELMSYSPMLGKEIEVRGIKTAVNTEDPNVTFKNGSWIKVVPANENARSGRANVMVYDEFRMIDFGILKSVLRRLRGTPRQPPYLRKKEYAHLKERNKEIYLSSAWYKHHWSWFRLKAFFGAMISGRSYFICGLPYQLSVSEGLLSEEDVRDEMLEEDFDEVLWEMEMSALFFGENEKSFYKFEHLEVNRKEFDALYPPDMYTLLKGALKPRKKHLKEIRFVSIDVALMQGASNDASVYTIFSLVPKSNGKGFKRKIEYMESMVGGHTLTQAIRIRQMFEDFQCDYIVIDAHNTGGGIYDMLVTNLIDKERGTTYEAFSCMNEEKMAERCLVPDSPKLIYTIKATDAFNNEAARLLRDSLKQGKIELLVTPEDVKQNLYRIKGFDKLPRHIQQRFISPYLQTSAFINETIRLERVNLDSIYIKLKEPSGGRKDRYSSVLYGNYFANELERELSRTLKEDNWEDYTQLIGF